MRGYALAAAVLAFGTPVRAQIDGTKRLLLEGGYEDGIVNPGPNGAYAFLYMNRPGVAGPGSALRLALAPVYADAELGLPEVFARTDLGAGFSGGGYAYGGKETVRGSQRFGQSFTGHGGGPSLSLYPKLGSVGPLPLNGVLRASAVHTDYQRAAATDPDFVLPPDQWTGAGRTGLRLGGQAPGLGPDPALELSAWYEIRFRDKPAAFGYRGDRFVPRQADLYWVRALVVLPSQSGVRWAGGVSLGGGDRLDRLDAYRLGGMLTQSSEFPLILPGYFSQELVARDYAHAWARAGRALDRSGRFVGSVLAAGAALTPVPGSDPGGPLHAGVGASLEFIPARGALSAELSYGYAPRAARGNRRGGHSVALALELDLRTPGAARRRDAKVYQKGLGWLLGR